MLFVLILLSLSQYFYRATLARPTTATIPSDLVARLSSPVDNVPAQRSIWDIVWSCLVTMTACSWVSSHPNIPDPRGGPIAAVMKLKIMFWALIAPELIIMWAMRQFYGARRIRDAFREQGWTLIEGHFLQMGGFVYSNNGSQEVLSFDRFKDLLNSGRIEFPKIEKSQIEDKSKGDAFSKLVAVFQTSWFVVQCIARAAQRLPVTQLELATVALAALNALMYAFWWYKPQEVRCPISVQATYPRLTDSPAAAPINRDTKLVKSRGRSMSQPLPSGSKNALNSSKILRPDTLTASPADAPITGNTKSPKLRDSFTSQLLPSGSKNALNSSKILSSDALDDKRKRETGDPNSLPRVSILRLVPNLVWRIDMERGATHVPMLYSIDPDLPNGGNVRFYQIVATGAVVGTIFGSIHCIAWTFEFPSRIESVLWRTSSLVVTVIPILLIVAEIIYRLVCGFGNVENLAPSKIVDQDAWRSRTLRGSGASNARSPIRTRSFKSIVYDLLLKISGGTYIALSVTCLFLYIAARFILLTEAVISLRHLPHSALDAVQWALSVPHTG